jgi:hypothetical protein
LARMVGEDEDLLRGRNDAMKAGVQASRDEARSDAAATIVYENQWRSARYGKTVTGAIPHALAL